MNLIFVAGIFDQPWIVAVILIVGAFVNWLTQQRQAKQRQDTERRANEAAPETPQKPESAFDVEEALRRLLGEEPPTPPPMPPSPPIIPKLPSPPPVWRGNLGHPILTATPAAVAVPPERSTLLSDATGQAALRLAQADAQLEHPKVEVLRRRSAPSGAWTSLWRDRPSARRAFVASLVFGPPKGLEP